MDPPPPVKPPRGIKSSKETSGLLMKVIRTLSSSESNEEREREKARLERDYKRSDKELNELVSLHNEDLAQVMQLFSKISVAVSNARERLRFISESLRGCKSLLSCRRDELKKLWLEGIEQKHILELLEQIEELKEVPMKLDQHIENQEYLLASKLLVSALNLGDGSLAGVEALKELRSELRARRETLYELLLEEISSIVYPELMDDDKLGQKERFKGDYILYDNTSIVDSFESNLLSEKDCSTNPNNMAVLVECLSLLKKLENAIEKIKVNFQKDIGGTVNKISKNLVAFPTEGIHPLVDFFNIILKNFRKTVNLHSELIQCFYNNLKGNSASISVYKISDVWLAVQLVLQQLLTDYLDIQNASTETQERPSYSEQSVFLSSYFNRRKTRPARPCLFKFENSSLTNMYCGKEAASSNVVFPGFDYKPERVLVCSPDPQNILLIFQTLTKFILEIEREIGLPSGTICALHTFLNDYLNRVFLTREMSRICLKVESTTKTCDSWSRYVSVSTMTENNLASPILQSTFSVYLALSETEKLLETLDVHSEKILEIMDSAVKIYSDTCNAAYRGIVQPDPEDKRLCSAAWLEDEDINRFLKSLPNWTDLQARKSASKCKKGFKREDTVEEESPEDIRQRNMKEAEILVSNLGETGISIHEIISDASHLTSLALMQESMEWFASMIHNLLRKIKKLSNEKINSSKHLEKLQKFANDFEDLANTCLLVLHLEVRVQCFHYLLPKGNVPRKNCKNPQELEPKILELSRSLLSFDDALSLCLQLRKKKYIFEGLGHLIAKILLGIAQNMEMSDESSIQKMLRNTFTLQQTITNITVSREVALEHVRNHLLELFNSTEE